MSLFNLLKFLLLVKIAHGSEKKGVSLWPGQHLCDDFKVLNNMSWWYDWQMNLNLWHRDVSSVCPPSTDQNMPPHIPMVKKYKTHTVINVPWNAQFILGFNEPDHTDQADMTPQEAADAWPEIEKHSRGKPLVSPSTAGRNFHWYDEFFRLCHGCRVDYLAAHMYHCDANQVMSYLKALYHRYHKKIWLTEFACPQSHDERQQLHLMQTLLPQLEAADYVFRYSWYESRVFYVSDNQWVTPAASLFHNGSSTLTTIGRFYNNFQGNGHNAHVVG